MRKYHIYGMGAALVDTEIEVAEEDLTRLGVDKGLMTLVDEARQADLIAQLKNQIMQSRRASGGSAGNTIIAASYFGASTFFSGKVADDDNGHFYMADMARAGVTTPSVKFEAGVTGKCLILITPDAERSMNTYLGASENFSERELDLDAIKDSEYVYIESYLVTSNTGRAAAISARQHAQQEGTKVALSFSDPGIVQHFREGINQILGEHIDLVFCNKDEALCYTGADSIDAAIVALSNIADEVVITLGGDGAIIVKQGEQYSIPGVKVHAVDTNGAGDMFAGAYLRGITSGLSPQHAGEFASKAAAQVVSQFGPRLREDQYRTLLH